MKKRQNYKGELCFLKGSIFFMNANVFPFPIYPLTYKACHHPLPNSNLPFTITPSKP